MGKFKTISLSVFGGVDVTFTIFMPLLIAILWVSNNELGKLSEYFIYGIGAMATIFRAIKIGWLKKW